MDILIVSGEDLCRSRMAQQLLLNFGRGMKITTSGAIAGNYVPEMVGEVLKENGLEISNKKPTEVDEYADQAWDCVITLCCEAEERVKDLRIASKHYKNFSFDDPFAKRSPSDESRKAEVMSLYTTMYRELYRYYRDVLTDLLMPSCTCGANTYCRCE